MPQKGRGLRVEVDAPRRAAAQRRSSVVSGEACGPVQVVSIAAQRTRWAVAKMALYGHPDAMANLIRRTLMVTRAPILNSLRRMAPQVASARSVVCKARRRRLLTRTYAIEANHRRSWLAAMGRGAVSEQVDLTFLDAVLHLAA